MLLGLASSAFADSVDKLISRMLESSDYKQRLSAALNLQKTGDARAAPAYIKALDDSDKTVRGVAAAALGKLIDANTKPSVRTKAMEKLKTAASSDDNAFVRKQAQKAYDSIKNLGSGGSGASGAKIYVDVGKMTDDTGTGAAIANMMRTVTLKTLKKTAPGMSTDFAAAQGSDKKAVKKALAKAGMTGYYVDGTLNALDVTASGSSASVSCTVNMLLASFPDKSMFGFLKGSAKVTAGNTPKDIGYAKEDCVGAVVEDLVRKKIIPTIETRTP